MRASHPDRRRVVAAPVVGLVAAVLAVGGCASTPEPVPPPSTTPAATAPAASGTTSTTRDLAADEDRARRSLPRADQLPGGPWIEGEARPSSAPAGLSCTTLAERAGAVGDAVQGAARASSGEHRDLVTGSALAVDVTVLADGAAADVVEAAYTDDRYPACLAEQLGRAGATAADPAGAGPVAVEDLTVSGTALPRPPSVGRAAAWSVTGSASDATGTVPTTAVVAVVRLGRVLVTVTVTGPAALDGATVAALVDEVARRADAAG